MLLWDGTAQATAEAPVRGACWLVEWDFSTGILRSTNYPLDITTVDAFVWTRAGNALSIGQLSESEDVSPTKLEIAVSVADNATLAWAIGDPTVWRGRPVRIYLQLLTETGARAGAHVRRFTGYMDSIAIERPSPAPGNSEAATGGTIKVSCSRAGLSRSRRTDGLRLTHAQQLQRYPGDNGYEYVTTLIEVPTLWLSKRFQEV